MSFECTVQGGVVPLPQGVCLPDGTIVTVTPRPPKSESPDNAEKPDIWQKLLELARWVETQPCDLPEDLAANHDHYLHGLPKRT